MKTDYNTFFNIKLPAHGHHCPQGNDDLHVERNLHFTCTCGRDHSSIKAYAHITFPLENKTVYSCPQNKLLLVLVRPKGLFSIKGLKTIAAYEAQDNDELNTILSNLESRKRRD